MGKKEYIPVGTETIERYAYYEHEDIEEVVFSDGVETIGESAFMGCTGMQSLVLPESMRKISWNAFSGCTSLSAVWLPFGLCEIGWGAFRDCTSLSELTVPISVTEIGDCAFEGCVNLRKLTLPVKFRGREAALGIPERTTVIFEDYMPQNGGQKEKVGEELPPEKPVPAPAPPPLQPEPAPAPPPPQPEPAPVTPPPPQPASPPRQPSRRAPAANDPRYAAAKNPVNTKKSAGSKMSPGLKVLLIVIILIAAARIILPLFEPEYEMPEGMENLTYSEDEENSYSDGTEYEMQTEDSEEYESEYEGSAEVPYAPETPEEAPSENHITSADDAADVLLKQLYSDIKAEETIYHSWLQTPEYNAVVESLDYGEYYYYIPDNDGSDTGEGIAICRVSYAQFDEVGAYGEGFLYYGNFVDGERSGWGMWLAANGERYYCYRGNWEYDRPNGYGEVEEYNEGVYTDMNSRRTRKISGNLVDGLWDGSVNWNFEYTNGETRENVFNFSYGNTSTSYNADKPNFPYEIVDTGGLLSFPVDISVTECGIIGFDEVGAMNLIYPN
ncbi:MAG: leucine-rich repeat domain-containing protein [Oscillospiraceae bacterium]|nr:leucine-rich repeat domain-containing protein [Oscillospiraceae bacterium]